MFTLIAHIHAKPEKAAELEALFYGFVKPTREEDGCIDYDFHRSTDDELYFMFYETWASRGVWENHLKMPHLVDFWANRMDYLQKDIEFQYYEMLSTAD